ncbi:MAG: 4Fe-4S binding protein [Pseudomonadota bacterium]
MEEVYKQLAEKLHQMPNGFPPTESGVELRILKKIFSPEEAAMALDLKPIPETAEAIGNRLGIPTAEMESVLDSMVRKGQIGTAKTKDRRVYLAVPFVVGIYEFQEPRLDKELADLIEEYAPALMPILGGHGPALMRVVPINAQVKAEHQVHPYEDIRKMLESAKSFQLSECICRKERALQGHECKHTLETCLAFSKQEGAFDKFATCRIISMEEALKVMADCEEEGLVHATYNVKSHQMFVCNCCSCCCGLLLGMKHFNAPFLVAGSAYVASVDTDTCIECGVCADERCPVAAITRTDSGFVVQSERCIGCGVCTKTCPSEAITLLPRPEAEQEQPPGNIMEWYFKRAESRGVRIIV